MRLRSPHLRRSSKLNQSVHLTSEESSMKILHFRMTDESLCGKGYEDCVREERKIEKKIDKVKNALSLVFYHLFLLFYSHISSLFSHVSFLPTVIFIILISFLILTFSNTSERERERERDDFFNTFSDKYGN